MDISASAALCRLASLLKSNCLYVQISVVTILNVLPYYIFFSTSVSPLSSEKNLFQQQSPQSRCFLSLAYL